jgi:DNA polymerase elongation subunit (family B)
LWLRADTDFVVEFPWKAKLYLENVPLARHATKHMRPRLVTKRLYNGALREVIEVEVPIDRYERYIARLEEETRFRVPLYNADLTPEQHFLFKRNLSPFTAVHFDGLAISPANVEGEIVLRELEAQVYPAERASDDVPIKGMSANGKLFSGTEREILEQFQNYFTQYDPDVIKMPSAFAAIPYIAKRLAIYDLRCAFHRWHDAPLMYRGGRSYWSYGQVKYQDYAVRLHGRLLLDTATTVGSMCDVDAIVELCKLSGNRFQQVASRSFGAVFQASLVRAMVQDDILVPYKEKPLEPPLSMIELLRADRAGHTYDPIIGFHTNVAEIDFASMYPWLIYNHNISADTLLSNQPPFVHVPGTHIRVSLARKGFTPRALKPMLDKRMWYKRNPSSVNKKRASGLKWVLVSCYGYLRFREFKLGLPSAHMAICAYARETLLGSAVTAESEGYHIVHGIIDALYLQKEGIVAEEVKALCARLELQTGIPLSFEGLFRWIVFLPSLHDAQRPVPTRYYGVFTTGEIKVRGIEVRQRSTPHVVRTFQRACLEMMAPCTKESDVLPLFPALCALLRSTVASLPRRKANELDIALRISKTTYEKDIPQKRIVQALQKRGIPIHPGMTIRFVYAARGVVLTEDYAGVPNIAEYTKRLVRSLFVLLQPFGVRTEDIEAQLGAERQATLHT